VNCRRTAQLALALGGFFGQDVALERLTTLDGTATANRETLGCASFGFHFRHVKTLLCIAAGGNLPKHHAKKAFIWRYIALVQPNGPFIKFALHLFSSARRVWQLQPLAETACQLGLCCCKCAQTLKSP
jgi:hypothetical protein